VADEFRTLAAEFRHEIDPVKGSRFLATVAPAASVATAEAFVERVRSEFPNATHNCWAYLVGGAVPVTRSSDDGEPGGSAGRPILAQIEGHGLQDVAVVVTRWFGGTKLGVGGLMRAYGGAAGQTLDRAPQRTVVVTRRVEVEHPYECSGAVQGFVAGLGIEPSSADYGASVRLVFDVPVRELEAFRRELGERTAGRAVCRESPESQGS